MSPALDALALAWTGRALEVAARGALAWLLLAGLEARLARSGRAGAWPRLRLAGWGALLAAPLVLALEPQVAAPALAGVEPWAWAGRAAARASAQAPLALARLAAGSWLVGCLALEAALLVRVARLRRALRAFEPASAPVRERARGLARALGLGRVPRVLLGPPGTTPYACGLLRPSVVLPRELCAPGRERELELVLAHELAHHARRDPWIAALLGQLALVAWPSPVAWSALGRAGLAQELACDRRVLRALPLGREPYLELLRARARRLLALPPARALALLGRPAALRVRIEALRGELRRDGRDGRGATGAAALAAAGLLVALVPLARGAKATAAPAARPPGCLSLRYTVLAELAREQALSSPTIAASAADGR